jgi:hypothetical protein
LGGNLGRGYGAKNGNLLRVLVVLGRDLLENLEIGGGEAGDGMAL